MESETYKLNSKELLVLVRYKHAKGDQKIPSVVADLHVRWNETQNRASPQSSPSNSDVKEEEDVNDKESGEMGTTGLVSGTDKSEDKSDNEEYINLHSPPKSPRLIVVRERRRRLAPARRQQDGGRGRDC